MLNRFMKIAARGLLAGTIGLSAGLLLDQASAQAKSPPYKIFLSMSYVGNDWQTESGNVVKAMAAAHADKVQFEAQVAGTDAQRQIQQINAMVQSGADAIVMFPISPTALNATIKHACDKGVKIFTYEAAVTEPCAYNMTIDEHAVGEKTAEWLVKAMNGKGNIVLVTGVPGTSTDTLRTEAAMEVFKKYPDIHIIANVVGMWSEATARSELSKVLATHPWKDIDGLWMQVGCYAAFSMMDEAGVPDAEKKPCVGEGTNGHRIQMLTADAGVDGAQGTYRPMGAISISYAAPLYQGGLQLKNALALLETGKEPPHNVFAPLPLVTNENVKLCKAGSWKEMADGCNVFQPSLITNPAWFSSIYSADTPEIGVNAALKGEPEPKE
ncbi:MAG TPA: sugar ABC transporter substrate-binding protein [Hypericibacter adhaerens]|jgi:ribose transport system substrate-binding protein|uniref:Sugar ABC transporter substrate-binding protein n=1 Tax=Hypericibacter adhaerens TaxID=2602016 RepID=A0A5J6N782_9PROT|nr:sugar ABC transporter substrate-binding protein [Hypericibacter adhaerens]QEX24653.1 sugar ABC transporter substrate-binding protein [Hypericibacter adhaerens]HWA45863.1 sugar ABC transporter substrate-binding protein [Hypericibacter adhaerens]